MPGRRSGLCVGSGRRSGRSTGAAVGDGPSLHNPEAEIAVLGACLLTVDAAETVCGTLRETDLFDARHQRILRTVRTILSRGERPDVPLVAAELVANGGLEAAGGAAYLSQLWEAVPSAANVRRYVALVQEAATRRRVKAACLRMAQAVGESGAPLPELLADLSEDVACAGGDGASGRTVAPVKLVDALTVWRTTLDDDAPPPRRVRTGVDRLDWCCGGGLLPGKLIILAARPSVGKSALALQMATSAAQDGLGVLVVSQEMLVDEQVGRLLAQAGRVDGLSIVRRRFTSDEYHRISTAYNKLASLPLWITDQADSLADIERMVGQWPYTPPLGLVIVDYLQLVSAPPGIKERRLQVDALTRGLKRLSIRAQVPIVALCSLTKDEKGQEERPPAMNDLRESGQIQFDADVVLFLHRKFDETETQLRVAKNRGGRVGKTTLEFTPEFVMFTAAPGSE